MSVPPPPIEGSPAPKSPLEQPKIGQRNFQPERKVPFNWPRLLRVLIVSVIQVAAPVTVMLLLAFVYQANKMNELRELLAQIKQLSSIQQKLDDIGLAQKELLVKEAAINQRLGEIEKKQENVDLLLANQTSSLTLRQKEFADTITMQYWKLTALTTSVGATAEQTNKSEIRLAIELTDIEKLIRDTKNIILLMDVVLRQSRKP